MYHLPDHFVQAAKTQPSQSEWNLNKKLIILMKTALVFMTIATTYLLISCEKSDNAPKNLNTDFNKRILDGYFVTSIAFDNQANAWIGTFKQGLIKYNSDTIILYNSSNSIISDSSVIYDIQVDSKNNIWISCEGLIKYDGNKFTRFNSTNTPIPEDYVRSIAIDSKDNIWFASCVSNNGGLVKYDANTWSIYTPDNSELPANLINDIAVDKNDNIWVTTHSKTLTKISNSNNWITFSFDSLNGSYYVLGDIEINSKQDIYIVIYNGATSGGIAACMECSKLLIFDGHESLELYNDSISMKFESMVIDTDDNIWSIDRNYYAIYNGNSWITDNTGLEEESLFAIAQALDGKIWIGTGNGIYIND